MSDWKKVLLSPSDNLLTAIKVLEEGGMRIALIIDGHGGLRGTITDGDIRRSILHRPDMNVLVTEVMRCNPITALVTDKREDILAMMKEKDLLHIPVLDAAGHVVGLETLHHLLENCRYDNPVLLMAGGFGTRLHPLTKDKPKPLLEVGGKPILETILNQFVEAGFNNFYISTHYKADMVRDYFGDGSKWEVKVQYLYEENPLGTAGALGLLPKDLLELPVLMMNGDLFTKVNFSNLLTFHKEQKGLATMCVRKYDIQVPFGVVETSEHNITRIVEKPVHNFFVNAGIYVLEPELIREAKAEYQGIPELFDRYIGAGARICSFPIHEYWLDIGGLESYERANRDITA